MGILASFGGVAWVMVIMRLIDRHFSSTASLGWDDFLIGLSGVWMKSLVFIPLVIIILTDSFPTWRPLLWG